MMPTSVVHSSSLQRGTNYFAKLILVIGLFLFSGFTSSYLYVRFIDKGGVFFPGILYTSSTILIFLFPKVAVKSKSLLIYFLLMNMTYLVVWSLTMISSWFAFFGGILTAGIGAIVTFILVDRFIVTIKFSKVNTFVIGGAAFLIIDILYAILSDNYGKTPIEYILKLNNAPKTLFAEVFVFWHPLVGARLFATLFKNLNTQHGKEHRLAASLHRGDLADK